MPKVVSARQRLANRQNARRPRRRVNKSPRKHRPAAATRTESTIESPQPPIPSDSTLKNLLDQYKPRNQIERTLVERIAICTDRLSRSRRFESDAVREAYLDLGEIDTRITELRRQLVSDEESLQNARRLSQLLYTPDDQLTPDERDSRALLYDQFVHKHRMHFFGPDPKHILAAVIDMIPRVIGMSAETASALHNELKELEAQRDKILQSRREANLLPSRSALQDLVRYECMLDRHLHRAIAALERSRRSSIHGPRRHKCHDVAHSENFSP